MHNRTDSPRFHFAPTDTALATTNSAQALTVYGGLTQAEAAEVVANIEAAASGNTRRVYASQWRRFAEWCAGRGDCALPASPEVVALYLGRIESSNSRYVARAAIRAAHKGHVDPTAHDGVKAASKGAARKAAKAGVREHKARAMTQGEMHAIVAWLDSNPDANSERDAALICAGWWSACRRSELVAWRCEDIAHDADGGATIFIPQSKTDQGAEGQYVYLPAEAARRMSALCAGRKRGYVFTGNSVTGNRYRKAGETHALDGGDVSLIIKRRAEQAGIPDAVQFSGHSLRRGFVTDRAERGAALADIAEQTRHKSLDTLRGYNAAGKASVKRVLAL